MDTLSCLREKTARKDTRRYSNEKFSDLLSEMQTKNFD